MFVFKPPARSFGGEGKRTRVSLEVKSAIKVTLRLRWVPKSCRKQIYAAYPALFMLSDPMSCVTLPRLNGATCFEDT